MITKLTKRMVNLCDMFYDWFYGDETSQSDIIDYCYEHNLDYDFFYNFVLRNTDEKVATRDSWKEIYKRELLKKA